jgi:hypothetical protein
MTRLLVRTPSGSTRTITSIPTDQRLSRLISRHNASHRIPRPAETSHEAQVSVTSADERVGSEREAESVTFSSHFQPMGEDGSDNKVVSGRSEIDKSSEDMSTLTRAPTFEDPSSVVPALSTPAAPSANPKRSFELAQTSLRRVNSVTT